MAFPTSIPSYAGFTSGHTLAADNHAAQHNQEQADIVGAALKIGTGSSTPTSGKLLRGNGTGTSIWGQADLTTDVTGVLPVANGGNGTTSTTGTGSAVFSAAPALTGGGSWAGSPTISTPTIADFTNSQHNHTNAGGGGQLPFAALLSTVFSGQVQTQANSGSAGGTNNYVNLGGIKLLWLQTSAISIGVSATVTGVVNMPNGFFNTVTVWYVTPATVTGFSTSQVPITTGGWSTTTGSFFATNLSGAQSGALVFSVLVIGT